MSMSAFELSKYSERTNMLSHILETPIVKWGRVIKVIDIETVVAESVVRTTLDREVYTVTLLNLSSALLEINAWPKVGDSVLLLFLQKFDARMFHSDFIENESATGYNCFSGVGLLASTVQGAGATILKFYENGGVPVASFASHAEWSSSFHKEVAFFFCRAVADSDDEALISFVFGEGRPLSLTFLPSAPVTLNIQSEQDITIGKDFEGKDTEASINIALGKKADLGIESEAKCTASFKSISLESKEKATVKAGGESLGAIISELIDLMVNFDSTNAATGSPVMTGPVTKPKLMALKTRAENMLSK